MSDETTRPQVNREPIVREFTNWLHENVEHALAVKQADARREDNPKVAAHSDARLSAFVDVLNQWERLGGLRALPPRPPDAPDETTLELKYRRELWLGHGHEGPALYGDDGEMQCKACRTVDYLRAPLAEVERAAHAARRERVREALAKPPASGETPPPWTRAQVEAQIQKELDGDAGVGLFPATVKMLQHLAQTCPDAPGPEHARKEYPACSYCGTTDVHNHKPDCQMLKFRPAKT